MFLWDIYVGTGIPSSFLNAVQFSNTSMYNLLITFLVIGVHFTSSFTPSPVSLPQISANIFLQICVSMYFGLYTQDLK